MGRVSGGALAAFVLGATATVLVFHVSTTPRGSSANARRANRAGRGDNGGGHVVLQHSEMRNVMSPRQFVGVHHPHAGSKERTQRERLYALEVSRVTEHNDQSVLWKEAVNSFSTLTPSEKHVLLGHGAPNAPKDASLAAAPRVHRLPMGLQARRPPSHVDWREKGMLTPVKQQGWCGGCWAFAATEAVESHWAIQHGKAYLATLGVQQILSCAPIFGSVPWSPGAVVNGSGCFGGFATSAYDYMINAKYVTTELAFPYVSGMPWRFPGGLEGAAQNGQCRGPYDIFPGMGARYGDIVGPAADHADWEPSALTFGATVTGFSTVERCSQGATIDALAYTGPVSVAVDASQWHAYDSGIFDGCNQTDLWLNHAVLLVGYGRDDDLKTDYWLVRNSWGVAWGEGGYIRLKRGGEEECTKCQDLRPWIPDEDGGACADVCGACGLLTMPSYPVVGPMELPDFDDADAH